MAYFSRDCEKFLFRVFLLGTAQGRVDEKNGVDEEWT
jgi:hypothetical protein